MNLPLPALTWLPAYDKRWLSGDLIAGVTLAAYLLPAGLGDASLANLPPEAGLYACLFSGLVFWLFCSSRHTLIAFIAWLVKAGAIVNFISESVKGRCRFSLSKPAPLGAAHNDDERSEFANPPVL